MEENKVVFRAFDKTRPIIWVTRQVGKIDGGDVYELTLRRIKRDGDKTEAQNEHGWIGGIDDEGAQV